MLERNEKITVVYMHCSSRNRKTTDCVRVSRPNPMVSHAETGEAQPELHGRGGKKDRRGPLSAREPAYAHTSEKGPVKAAKPQEEGGEPPIKKKKKKRKNHGRFQVGKPQKRTRRKCNNFNRHGHGGICSHYLK